MYKKRNIFITLTILWIGVIYFFTLQTGEDSGNISESFLFRIINLFGDVKNISYQTLESLHYILRKCAHFTEYMILGFLTTNVFLCTKIKKKVLASILLCVAVAMLDEVIQLLVPGRVGSIKDVMIDTMGAVVGTGIMTVLYRKINAIAR